jgi:hypothetical protein
MREKREGSKAGVLLGVLRYLFMEILELRLRRLGTAACQYFRWTCYRKDFLKVRPRRTTLGKWLVTSQEMDATLPRHDDTI